MNSIDTAENTSAPDHCKVALAQYPVDYFETIAEFREKLEHWVKTAASEGAQLLLFPEYAAMELCSLLDKPLQNDLQGQLQAMQAYLPLFLETHQQLAQQYQVTLVAGSFPVKIPSPEQPEHTIYVNRSHVIHPDGRIDFQDKQIMTRFETEEWGISPGTGIKVISTAVGKIGISICYDSEFPLIARRQIELGADFILVPSVTETLAGYYRVRTGSQARALENQCYVLHAPLVGEAPWSPAVDVNVGRAGVYTPMDKGLPDDGVMVIGELNQQGWIYATLDKTLLQNVRHDGHVLNHRDWALQATRTDATG
ncbi:MAG: carbon-nitrogen hydrolase family protein [Thiolinea sp.]